MISPVGNEMGLMAYLPFNEMKENSNGIYEQIFSVNDQRVFKTTDGTIVDKQVPLVLNNTVSPIETYADKSTSAPTHNMGKLTKLNFDWAFNNDELMINLNMLDREINKRAIYVTVRSVEDLNGNPMVSPVTWTAYVDKNALKWEEKTIIPANCIRTPSSPCPIGSLLTLHMVRSTPRRNSISPSPPIPTWRRVSTKISFT